MPAQAVEVDDFGLPIRRYPTPENDPPTEQDAKEEDGAKLAKDEKEKTAVASDTDATKHEDTGDMFHDAPVEPEQPPPSAPPKEDAPLETTTEADIKPTEAVQEKPREAPGETVKEKSVEEAEPSKTELSHTKTSSPTDTPKPETHPTESAKQEIVTKNEPTVEPQTPSQPNGPATEAETKDTIAHKQDASNITSEHRGGVSEFSHQRISMADDAKEDKDAGWQEMPSYARYDMYDDDDRLIAREFNADEEETYGYAGLGGAGKGYTRVIMDDDVESATSMDDNTQYLFKQGNGTSAAVEDDEGRDAVSQMQATKDLLTEGQRIAYVGVVRLEIVNMVKIEEEMEKTKKTKKATTMSAEAMKMWGQKMMIRLYAHMDISEAEQIMIEQLAEHGVMPADLTPALITNARVHNPMADDASSTRSSLSSPQPSETPAPAPPPYEGPDGDALPEVKTPSQLPTTDKIDIDLRWTVLCDIFLILIADSIYDARSRVLLERVGKSLDVSWIDICRFEKKVTDALEMQQAAEKENWNEDEHMENRRKQALKRRYVMMGLATVGGGLVIGLSAGLLAPVIGAGLATGLTAIGVTGTSSFLGGVGGAAIITSGAAASGGIIGGKAADRRTGAVRTFEYRPLHNNKRVNLVVTISGWLTGKVDDVRLPFSTVDPIMGDLYSVLWEPEMLRSVGDTINILATEALTQSIQQVLGATILAGLMSALQLPIVLSKLSYLIDNPWAVSLDRAWSAGKILADSLIERSLGTRPITLVGYSIGARVIFSCLLELAKKGAHGIVQNVYMFGSPIVVKKDEYLLARTAVAGRFLNAYNRNDWILGYLFRLTNGGIRRVAGLGTMEECPWVENMDVTDLVQGHMDYRTKMPSLLMRCGWSVESEEFVEIEDPDPDNHAERQRELINEIEEARKKLEQEGNASKGSRFSLFGRRKKLEKADWEIYEDAGAKPKAEKEKEKEKDTGSSNHGVLFDIDAIRAEIAKDANKQYDGPPEEELQVKEIKSTLPPMKLDLSSYPTSPAQVGSPYGGGLSGRASYDTRFSREPSPSFPSPGYTRQDSRPPAYVGTPRDDRIHMPFDTSEDLKLPPAVPPKDTPPADTSSRPEFKTSQTMPVMTLHDPWDDPDDPDFGKEREIKLTFV